MLIHHSECGMQTFSDKEFRQKVHAETGHKPRWDSLAFTDVDGDVRISVERVTACPFLLRTDKVRGFVYDVTTGLLREVGPASSARSA